jgi:hypothetical protein
MIKAVVMGFSRKRTGRDGKPRYTAYYLDLRGQERSAGTFSNKKDANDAWKDAEAQVRAGKQGDPGRGKQTFQAYSMCWRSGCRITCWSPASAATTPGRSTST